MARATGGDNNLDIGWISKQYFYAKCLAIQLLFVYLQPSQSHGARVDNYYYIDLPEDGFIDVDKYENKESDFNIAHGNGI